ncbi:cytochrome P450 [Mytilinidion resinicola]|uniref:Cytochrome P450 n=1 Tax=Mytilinidion resinicola TaxID=574789 RepID=A0A6A6YGU7_9PEZI|nr:cytochrome P450 [Mytilinidion resinicola]KAF2807819.1 cytochrome P450 [Mytilinidion resinicola]
MLPHLTIPKVIVGLLIFRIIYNAVNYILETKRLHRLGGTRAAIRTTYLPFGIDLVYRAVTSSLADKNYEMWLDMFKSYGKGRWTLEAGSSYTRIVFTADPENIKAILATQFKDFGKGERFNREWHDFLGDSIFTTDGDKWHDSRMLIRPQFIKDRLSDIDVFEKHFNVLADKLGGQGQEVDLANLYFRYTLDAATDFLLGRSVDSLHDPAVEFAHAFGRAQHIQGLITRIGPLNWLVPRKRMGFYESIKKVDVFINTYIEDALRLSPDELEKKSKSDEGYTFLHAIAGYTRDRKILRDQLAAVLLAGRDTTACTLTWLTYQLSMHPYILAKLRQEIVDVVGLDRRPTYDDLKSMKYLQHIMNETLRLYPVVPYNVRDALHDTTLPRGGGPDGMSPVSVLAGTPIGYSTLVMQRREDLYPPPESGFPPVDKFVPERWDGWTPKSWTYIPFNGGPRICIGQQFALTEMAYTVTRLFQRFGSVENKMGGEDPGMHCDIVLQPAKVVKVAFWDAKRG